MCSTKEEKMGVVIDKSGRHFRHTSVLIPEDLHSAAKVAGIKISDTLTEALKTRILEVNHAVAAV
jgi:hypothetical protein